jgi:aerobic-type carbon monoxide dehydrogenase small subunit (CoxS/CutS family)
MPNYTLNVNGKDYAISPSSGEMPLLWALRDLVGLTGTKYGCGIEVCGACTVLINGQPEKSCDMSVQEAAGRRCDGGQGAEGLGRQSGAAMRFLSAGHDDVGHRGDQGGPAWQQHRQ